MTHWHINSVYWSTTIIKRFTVNSTKFTHSRDRWICQSKKIFRIISHRLRWAGHVERAGEGVLKQVREMKVEGTRKKGRPRLTWQELVRKDMREVGLNREMAGNRAEWRRKCQTTVDPGVPGWTAVPPGKKKRRRRRSVISKDMCRTIFFDWPSVLVLQATAKCPTGWHLWHFLSFARHTWSFARWSSWLHTKRQNPCFFCWPTVWLGWDFYTVSLVEQLTLLTDAPIHFLFLPHTNSKTSWITDSLQVLVSWITSLSSISPRSKIHCRSCLSLCLSMNWPLTFSSSPNSHLATCCNLV